MLQFLSPIEGAALRKHIIKRIPLDSEHSCRVQCYLENTCVSYNFGKHASGGDVCELNNTTHTEHPYDLKTTRDFIYRGTEVRWFLKKKSLALFLHLVNLCKIIVVFSSFSSVNSNVWSFIVYNHFLAFFVTSYLLEFLQFHAL